MKRQQVDKIDSQRTESLDRHGSVASEGARVEPIHQWRSALGNRDFGRFIQAKLKVSQPGDEYEQEADRVANQVMRMTDPAHAQTDWGLSTASAQPQPMCSTCENEKESGETNEIHRKVAAGNGENLSAPATELTVNNSTRGEPLSEDLRSYFEPRFGQDFRRVRVHQDHQAAESARTVNALAYTIGHDIVFGAGQFAPATLTGKSLIAHELAHVVQQNQFVNCVGRIPEPVIQRFGAEEHRDLGNEASGTMTVNVGGTTPDTQFELQFGDVVMLGADLFGPDLLAQLAAIPGNRGRLVNTRDEIIYALYWTNPNDPRFGTGGIWSGYVFDPKVKKTVEDRYQALAAANAAHFVAPRGRDAAGQPLPGPTGESSAGASYRDLHESAIRMAYKAGSNQGNISQAMAREAAAQHFLSDAFSAGHLRTPIGQIRDHWNAIYPLFWYNLRHKIALDTAIRINAQTTNVSTIWATVQDIYEKIVAQVEAMVHHIPQVTLGDLLGKLFHDFDNVQGLNIGGGQLIFGDSNLNNPSPQNVTRRIAVGAMRAGIQDIREAFSLGQMGTVLTNVALYDGVRTATGAPPGTYVAETQIPRPDPGSLSQNWRAPDFETLWTQPVVGTLGLTVGNLIWDALQPGKAIRKELDDMAQHFKEVDPHATGDVYPRRGYLEGFVNPLAANPRAGILAIINWAPNYGLRTTDRDDISLVTGKELNRQGNLGGMTTTARVSYIRELIDGWVSSDEEELVVRIFETAPPTERPRIYRLVEGHPWTGNWIEGVFVSDDEIWNALNRSRLARLRTLINAGWSGP